MSKPSEARLYELEHMTYQCYLSSPEWKRTRAKVLKRDNRACRICNRDTRVEVHHRKYDARGTEKLEDLITLCHECHEMFHNNTSSPGMFKGNMRPDPVPLPIAQRNEPPKTTAFNGHKDLPPMPRVDMQSCRLCAKRFKQRRKGVMYMSGNIPVCRMCFKDYAELRDEIFRIRGVGNPKSVYVIRRVEYVTDLVCRNPSRETWQAMVHFGKLAAKTAFTTDGYINKFVRANEDYAFDEAVYEKWKTTFTQPLARRKEGL